MTEPRPNRNDFDDHDAYIEAFAQWWEARAGLPPGGRDPGVVRADVRLHYAAAMAVFWGLRGSDRGVAAAVDWAAIHGAGGVAALPAAVRDVVAARIDTPDRDVLAAALAAIVNRADAADRTHAELTIWRMVTRVADALPDTAREQLAQRLVDGDTDFWLRCYRAGLMCAIGQVTDDDDMLSAATDLAILECHEYRHWGLSLPTVFSTAGPVIAANTHPDGTIDRDALVAALKDGLAAATATMLYPDADVGAL
jgi:hypothetical protein